MKLMGVNRLWLAAAAVAVAVALVLLPAADGLWFDLPSTGSKCVSEELYNHVVVLVDYYAFVGGNYNENATFAVPTINVKVTSPYGNDLHHKQKVAHGQFAFTMTEAGTYLACFTVDNDLGGKTVTVGIDWKTGIAAKDWETVARKEKLEGLALELRKLEGSVQTICVNLEYLKIRESKMREVSETTNARVARYSIMALGVCIVASVCQVWYLRRYFHKKKLI